MDGDTRQGTLLVIDDDELFCDATAEYLQDLSMNVLSRHRGDAGLEVCRQRRVDVVILDQNLPDARGHTLCPQILEANEHTKIIFVTAHPSFDTAVEGLRAGAFDYLSKPFESEQLRRVVRQALRTLDLERMEDLAHYRHERAGREVSLVGRSRAFENVRELASLASSSDAPVLITGETGTGKTHVARAIHYTGPLRRKAFISTNCAALPRSLIEAELFGHEKGAFTGADSRKPGIFEMAEGGTLFLDEIGEMPVGLQAKLLGVLEDGQVRRLGGTTIIPVDARVVAATSRELEEELDETFRADLYFRLSVIRIHIPPLRDRPEDVRTLALHILTELGTGEGVDLSEEELRALERYDWLGNVRELRNVLERAIILQVGRGRELEPSKLLRDSLIPDPGSTSSSPRLDPELSLEEMERQHIQAVLDASDHNLTRSARTLGIALSTLKRKLKKYGLR